MGAEIIAPGARAAIQWVDAVRAERVEAVVCERET
jgi:hypothetical protein